MKQMTGVSEETMSHALAAIYDVALGPGRWPDLLQRLARLFDSHFADVFVRTIDRTTFRGIAYGLTEIDYQDEFLDTWFKRNVFGNTAPVEVGGDVVTTREMLPKAELVRSEIFVDYLDRRDLHEGLRLKLWSGEGWVQDVSLMRAWSGGAFDDRERAAARHLVPHLQRAVLIARRLQTAELSGAIGFEAFQHVGRAAFGIDATGRIVRMNRAAEAMLQAGDVLRQDKGTIAAQGPDGPALLTALARASSRDPAVRQGAILHPAQPGIGITTGPPDGPAFHVVPLPAGEGWHSFGVPSALLLVDDPGQGRRRNLEGLARRIGLTAAEAHIAAALLDGRRLSEIAAQTSRSPHTVRTHLAHLMHKTGTHRQVDLIRRLDQLTADPATRAFTDFA